MEANAQTTNIVDSMDILNMVNATAMMDISGSTEPADPAETTKVSTEFLASATSATLLIKVETASNPTSNLTATKMKDMTQPSRPAFVFKEPNTSKENV